MKRSKFIAEYIKYREKIYPARCGEYSKYCYLFFNTENARVKIGITNNIKQRFAALCTQSGCNLVNLFWIELQEGVDESPEFIEKYLHEYFAKQRIRGEWFTLSHAQILNIYELFFTIEGDDMGGKLCHNYKETNKHLSQCLHRLHYGGANVKH